MLSIVKVLKKFLMFHNYLIASFDSHVTVQFYKLSYKIYNIWIKHFSLCKARFVSNIYNM